jgi:aldehyde:ferredoxin oxidoreductase
MVMALAELSYDVADVERGYTDRILICDLSAPKLEVMEVPPDMRKNFTGGRGYAMKLIFDRTTADTKWDSVENVLVLASGPLGSETSFPGTGKFVAATISPLTGTFVDSNVGGHFGPLAKLAGFDAVAITGKSAEDVVIIIDGDKGVITIEPASEDEGCITTSEKLMNAHQGDGKLMNVAVASAGIGGRKSRFGIINCIYYDMRRKRVRAKQAGRGGTGTVMRDKGLKAVLAKSNKRRGGSNHAANPELVRKASKNIHQLIQDYDLKQLHMREWGTTVLVGIMNQHELLPVNNYKFGSHPEATKIIDKVWLENYFMKKMPDGCYLGCTLACTHGTEDFELSTGHQKGQKVGIDGPEYETAATGSSCGIFDPEYLLEFNWYCDEYGIDTISTGITIGFLMECFERGLLTEADLGMSLKFGDKNGALDIMHLIGKGEGFGQHAGQGIRRLREYIAKLNADRGGGEYQALYDEIGKFAMECKGMEFSVYVTKESLAQQGGYGFALKGAQHDEAWLIFLDQINNEMPTFEDKARALRWFPLFRTWFNAVGLCKLPWIDVRHPDAAKTEDPAKNLPNIQNYVDFANGTLGTSKTLDDIIFDSERLYNFQKLINIRQGYGTREHDHIPERAMGPVTDEEYISRHELYDEQLAELLGTGKDALPEKTEERRAKLMEFRRDNFEKLMDAVYKEKGWDNNGVPTDETMNKFGLLDDNIKEILNSVR